MDEPIWLHFDLVCAAHSRQLLRYDGIEGIKEGILRSAIDRPRNLFLYENPDLPDLAAAYAAYAAYAYGIIQNHPFSDGNKRAAFISAFTFLELNGVSLVVYDDERYEKTLALAAGSISESDYAAWIRDNCR